MSAVDIGVGVVLLWLAWQGFSRGLVGSLVWLLIMLVTPMVAGRFSPLFTGLVSTLVPNLPPFVRQPVSVGVSLFVTGIVLGLLAGVLTGLVGRLLPPMPMIQLANRATGVFVAMSAGVLGLAMATILVSGFLSVNQHEQLKATIWGDAVVPRLQPLAPLVRALLPIPDLATPCDLPPEVIGAALAKASPGSTTPAAQALLSAMPADSGSGSNVEAARPLFEAFASGGATQNLPPEATVALAGAIKTMLGCPGTEGGPGATALPAGSTDAARLFLEAAMSGQGR